MDEAENNKQGIGHDDRYNLAAEDILICMLPRCIHWSLCTTSTDWRAASYIRSAICSF